jgi:hypothetical protein
MPAGLPPQCARLLERQDGVITVGQAVAAGMSDKSVRDQVRAGRWQLLHRGVYAGFTGRPDRRAQLWGALLRAGPDAVLRARGSTPSGSGSPTWLVRSASVVLRPMWRVG